MKRLLLSATILGLASTAAFADGLTSLGLDDPEVMAPPSVSGDWSGPYIGLSYGRTETTTPVYDVCIDDGGHSGGDKCSGKAEYIDLTFGPGLEGTDNYTQTGFMSKDAKLETATDRVFLLGEAVTIVDAKGNVIGTGTTVGEYATGTLYRPETGETKTVSIDEVGAFLGYRHDFGRIVVGAEIGMNGDLKTLEAQVGLDLGKVLPYAFAGVGELDGESGNTYGVGADVALGKNLLVGVKTTRGEFGDTDLDSTLVRVAIQF